MPKQIDFRLNRTELSIIEESLKRSESARVVKRATAIRMLHLGQKPEQVSEILSVSLPTIYGWFIGSVRNGYDFTLWTVQRLNQHVSKVTGKQLVDERVRLILKERGWVYRRPKEDLSAKQDKGAREWAAEFFEELKKEPVSPKTSSFSLWMKQP